MKTIVRDIVILIVFIIISFFCTIQLDDFFMNTIYTVSGIMFSIGLGLVATFNLQGIKNKNFISRIRTNLNHVRNSYIKYFTVSTLIFIADKYLRDRKISQINFGVESSFDFSILFCLIILFSIMYYVINFISLQSLNNQIFDKLNEN